MFGERIAEQRKKLGLNQEELAGKIGVSRSALSLYEIDRREPDLETVKKIASLFGVTTDYLLGLTEGEDTMGTEENTNEIMQRVGRNLRTLRESKSIFTQQQLAERLGVGASTVGMWEQGRREPDLDTLARIAQFFEVTLDDLVMKELTPPVPLYVQNMIYLRKKIGYTQSEMAMELGLQGPSSIDIVESGKCELPVSKLIHLAEFFRVTMDQITKKDLSQEVSGCRQQ
jgi:transcriptional regulator with XRE-family HTH domain